VVLFVEGTGRAGGRGGGRGSYREGARLTGRCYARRDAAGWRDFAAAGLMRWRRPHRQAAIDNENCAAAGGRDCGDSRVAIDPAKVRSKL